MPGNPLSDELLGEILRGCEGVTPGPWKHGHWAGQCNKPEHRGNHPGLKGGNPCVYDYTIYEGGNGIASAQSRIEVIGSDYDGLVAKDADLDHIARLDPQTVSALVTELIERRKAGTFAEGIEAAAKVADIHADGYAEAIRGLTRNKFATEYRGKHDAARKIGRAIRSLTPNKDTTS